MDPAPLDSASEDIVASEAAEGDLVKSLTAAEREALRKARNRTVRFDPVSLIVGLAGGAMLVATAKALAGLPPEQQVALVKGFTEALQSGSSKKPVPPAPSDGTRPCGQPGCSCSRPSAEFCNFDMGSGFVCRRLPGHTAAHASGTHVR